MAEYNCERTSTNYSAGNLYMETTFINNTNKQSLDSRCRDNHSTRGVDLLTTAIVWPNADNSLRVYLLGRADIKSRLACLY